MSELSETEKTDAISKITRSLELVDATELASEIDSFSSLLQSQHRTYQEWNIPVVFRGMVSSDLKTEELNSLAQRLQIANYTIDSLSGENVIFFESPVLLTRVELVRENSYGVSNSNDVLRLISWVPDTKQVVSGPQRVDRGFKVHSIFDAYQVALGLILPAGAELKEIKVIDFSQLFSNSKLLTDLAGIRENLDAQVSVYKDNVKKCSKAIDEGIAFAKNEHEQTNESISILLDERTRIAESLDEISVIKSRLETELDGANKSLVTSRNNLKEIKDDTELALGDLAGARLEVSAEVVKITTLQKKVSLEEGSLTLLESKLEKAQSGIDGYSLNMNGFSKASRMHLWVCYMTMAALLSSLTNIFYQIYGNASSFEGFIDKASSKISTLDILLSRLPLITATTLVIGTLSTLLLFLIKHIVTLHTDKMNMLKSSILTEQVTYSLDCEGKDKEEVAELKRKSKIDILVKVFGFGYGSQGSAVDENRQIDLIAKVVDTLKQKG